MPIRDDYVEETSIEALGGVGGLRYAFVSPNNPYVPTLSDYLIPISEPSRFIPPASAPTSAADDYIYTRKEYDAAKEGGEVLEDTYEEYVEAQGGPTVIDPEADTVLDTLPEDELPDWWIPGLPEQWYPPWDPSGGGLPAPSFPEEPLPPLPPEFQWPEGLPGEPTDTGAGLPPLPLPPAQLPPTPGPPGAPEPAPVPVPTAPGPTTTSAPTAPSTPPSVLSRARDILGVGLPLLGLLGAITADDYEPGDQPPLPPDFEGGEALPPLPPIARHFQGLQDEESYYTYGQVGAPQSGEALFLAPAVNPFSTEVEDPPGGLGEAVGPLPGGPPPARLPPATFQRGGEVDYWEQNEDVFTTAPQVGAQGRYVKGEGSGRDDTIRAQLSAGEYVMDAETVALLGDGSGDEGARRLDEMRRNLRKHKAEKWSKGEFSYKAKNPDKYMGRLRRRAKTYEHGGVHNIGKGGRVI